MLWPPDGLNLKQGTSGEWFGYGYLPLPLVQAKTTTDGKDVPTGDQCWTLFLNAGNFKGLVAFFTPYFWSCHAVAEPRFAGQLLDSRPSNPNRAPDGDPAHPERTGHGCQGRDLRPRYAHAVSVRCERELRAGASNHFLRQARVVGADGTTVHHRPAAINPQ